ncbi:DUF4258 domain-containing protein [Streptomyces sp. NPDC051704]|uniref:DUF4258 domain-containing protein n=1 Tax=Streptomyces sp. NPDC051704 TaxID=3365671 RepID=UPI0037920F27
MINSKRVRLALVALAASAAVLTAAPAQAATPAPSQARAQAVATAQFAALTDSLISPMRCRDDGQGCPPVKEPQDCSNNSAPQGLRSLSQHIRDRMAERHISEDELQNAVRIGSRTAQCQDNGRWKYTLGMSGGELVVIASWNGVGVTAWWNN